MSKDGESGQSRKGLVLWGHRELEEISNAIKPEKGMGEHIAKGPEWLAA